jgi:hypothetical protein
MLARMPHPHRRAVWAIAHLVLCSRKLEHLDALIEQVAPSFR